MRTITCNLPDSLYAALEERMAADKETCDHLIASALAKSLRTSLHTLFQVSTSAALVEGLYQGAVRVSRLLRHGNFGLGTFADLDGEMVVLEGVCYQVSSTGTVVTVDGERLIPYAVVTKFNPDFRKNRQTISTMDELVGACDQLRDSSNVFYAFRVDGTFHTLKARVMKPVSEGTALRVAAPGQQEFSFAELRGTLVGLWSPAFAASFSVPGYHFHFLSEDRQKGGHVLECRASDVDIQGCCISEMHVSLPETEKFLKADLSRDPVEDLLNAERSKASSASASVPFDC